MDSKLQEILEGTTFNLQEGRYIYAKVKSLNNFDKHFMVSKDKDEITVVTREENLSNVDLIEKNKDLYRLFALNVTVPFYALGFLSAISTAIAKEGMNILIVSTYSKDYIMVRDEHLNKAKETLLKLGLKEKQYV